mmetsp:Transcript_12832/g.18406  ORF Transcript_12832/g.18406 Transcript_12832/m.18406 type:complete len:224 (+) Transcript_12832:221-892(+)
MKFELITALVAATSVTAVAAQEEEILYDERSLTRLESRRIKDKDNGKSSKNKLPGNSSKSSKSGYKGMYLLPFSCPKKCVEGAYEPGSTELKDAIQECDLSEEKQEWKIHQNDQIMKFEGYPKNEEGWCIGVDSACVATELSLVPCEEPQSEWYFTGGQLVSVYCWSRGIESKVLSVDDDCLELKLSDVDPVFQKMFMIVEKEFIASIPGPTQAPSLSSAPSQ